MTYFFQENPWGERYIPELNRTCFDGAPSSEFYDSDLDIQLNAPDTLHIIIGSDSGLLIRYLQTKSIPAGSRVVIVEPDDVFAVVQPEVADVLDHSDAGGQPQAITLHAQSDWQSEVFDGSDSAWFMAGDVALVQSRCAITDYPKRYYSLHRDSRLAIAERLHRVQSVYTAKNFTEQQMANIVDSHIPIHVDAEFGEGRVAVVLGGGPSLDDHLPWIEQNRDKLFVIAASRLCSKLDARALYPDLVVSIDPSPVMYSASKVGTRWDGVPLVHSYHVTPLLAQQWRGPRYYLGQRYPWELLNGKPTSIIPAAGPTVGHAAVVLASQLGFSTIVMSGVDLCFNASGSSHASGTPEAELLKLPGNYDAQVETYAGRQSGTSIDFYRSIDAMDRLGKAINEYTDVLFNLNINAAKVPSIKHKHQNDITLDSPKPEFNAEDYRELDIEDLAALRQSLNNYTRQFHTLRALCKKAERCLDKLYGNNSNSASPTDQKRLDALEARLEKAAPDLLKSIRYYMGPEFSRLRKPSGFANMSEEAMEDWARAYYRTTRMGARFFIEALKAAMDTVNLRERELAAEPDVQALLDSWSKQQTPGRILRFKSQLLQSAGAEEISLINQAETQYLESLGQNDQRHEQRILSLYNTLGKTLQSLRFLRHKQCVNDLETYVGKLQGQPWPYGTIAQFIQGNLAEMGNDAGTAIIRYQQVMEDCGDQLAQDENSRESTLPLIEETLTLLTRLYLDQQDGASAMETMGVLCEISPQYIASYANLLHLQGHADNAVALLMLYLENYPNDWRAARQLSQIHRQTGNGQLAEKARHLAETLRDTTYQHKPSSSAA